MSHVVIPVTLLLIMGLVVSDSDHSGRVIKQKSRNQPREGRCLELKWGGVFRLHWFSCCNNCVNGKPLKCDGKTWHSASNADYCGLCGVVKKVGGTVRKGEFSCGGCGGQDNIKQKCRNWWRKVPGFCWSFSKCFHHHCSKKFDIETESDSKDKDATPDSCYNGVCDKGETPENCPTDCCFKLNKDCDVQNGTWLPECCGEIGCCLTSEGKTNLAKTKQEL
ncbi:hypothetical protein KP79_PYT06850 [Mizuhopecten yessoensis]|uniref:Uncharacterized protein n=1 Tax=Mizuhopecten yessoensis TaxID=6573 RepID=A0A210QUZ3_MIZYE|nr:hypothetical protein KP79_PYT06851 [Mizuhopecten yessoensis]OWF52492.1 hypothetical protein KP79_PYT06850 [Mizuhopecten yessoensis]